MGDWIWKEEEQDEHENPDEGIRYGKGLKEENRGEMLRVQRSGG